MAKTGELSEKVYLDGTDTDWGNSSPLIANL